VGEIERLDRLNSDYVVPQSKMRMSEDGMGLAFGDTTYAMDKIAHEQVAARLAIPKPYYEATAGIQGLRAYNVNAWLDREPGTRRLVRTQDGRARAVLSDRFKPFDNIVVLGAALPVLAANPELQVRSAIVTPERLYLQCSFPKIAGEIKVGDVVEFGFTLTTSEVGRGKVDVQKWYRQLKCSNGWIGESLFSRRHVGRRIGDDEEDYEIFAADTIKAEMEAFKLKLRDIINAGMTREAFEEDLRKFKKADGDTFLHSQAEDTIRNVSKHFSLADFEMKAVLDRVMAEQRPSRLAIGDAITYIAHETDNLDRSYDLERFGGDLIAMVPREWADMVA